MRWLVCGSRYSSLLLLNYVYEKLSTLLATGAVTPEVLIHGAQTGVDTYAAAWGTKNDIPLLPFPARWRKEGLAAGALRNERMLTEGHPSLVIAFPGGSGTRDMIAQAAAAGIPIIGYFSPISEWQRKEMPN
jgi:hypothetical protein